MREFDPKYDKAELDNFEDEAYNAIADTIDEGAEGMPFGETWRWNLKNAAREYEELGWPLKKGYMLKALKAAARKYVREGTTQRGERARLEGSTMVITMPDEAGYRAYHDGIIEKFAGKSIQDWRAS